MTPFDYRRLDDLPDGGVFVVGGSATGVQLAAEIRRSGRSVTLSTGEHVRLPRVYRGRDGRALFSGGLRNVFALADLKMERLLDTFDEWARTNGRDDEVGPPERFSPRRRPSRRGRNST